MRKCLGSVSAIVLALVLLAGARAGDAPLAPPVVAAPPWLDGAPLAPPAEAAPPWPDGAPLAPPVVAAPPWPDDPVSRLEALALLQTLNADLLSHDSATLTLERWCGAHRLAEPAHVVAHRVRDVDKPAGEEQRRLLGVDGAEPVRYRRVRLHCGERVLSEADNWYVPARLTPDMNAVLDTTDTAFGRAVQALRFQRHTLSAELLWQPLPPGWATDGETAPRGNDPLVIPDEVLRHRAVLDLPDGTPFSLVVETYSREVLAFPPPKLR